MITTKLLYRKHIAHVFPLCTVDFKHKCPEGFINIVLESQKGI